MLSVVGAVLLRSINVWRLVNGDAEIADQKYNNDMAKHGRDVLNLSLDTCWDKNSRLRRHKIELLVAFSENEAWGDFLSSHPEEASAAVVDTMSATVDLLGRPQIASQDACTVLCLMSRVLSTWGLPRLEYCTHDKRSSTLSTREHGDKNVLTQTGHPFSEVTVRAYARVFATLDDSNECVRLCALETLGEFLPLMPPDNAADQRNVPMLEQGVQEGALDDERGTGGAIAVARSDR